DDFTTLGHTCDHYNLWLHVDGPYPLSHILSHKPQHLFKPIQPSHTPTSHPHKLLFQTYTSPILILKQNNHLLQTFPQHPHYFHHIPSHHHLIHPQILPIQLTPPPPPLKLSITLQIIPQHQIIHPIKYPQPLPQYPQQYLSPLHNSPIISHPNLSILNFTYQNTHLTQPQNNQLNTIPPQKIPDSAYPI
uniref:pyridoxal-dependent decarboxylase n=1 Tax=Staphylococcus epidermidis TaxID=1282 RepID=UPI0037D9A9A9